MLIVISKNKLKKYTFINRLKWFGLNRYLAWLEWLIDRFFAGWLDKERTSALNNHLRLR